MNRSEKMRMPCKCGNSRIVLYDTAKGWFASCGNCSSKTDLFETEEAAVEAWNKCQKSEKLKKIRNQAGMSKTQFSQYFNIPYRTIQNWELGLREIPDYVLELIQYKLDNEKKKGCGE